MARRQLMAMTHPSAAQSALNECTRECHETWACSVAASECHGTQVDCSPWIELLSSECSRNSGADQTESVIRIRCLSMTVSCC